MIYIVCVWLPLTVLFTAISDLRADSGNNTEPHCSKNTASFWLDNQNYIDGNSWNNSKDVTTTKSTCEVVVEHRTKNVIDL